MSVQINDARGGFTLFCFEAQGFLEGFSIGRKIYSRRGKARKSIFLRDELDEIQMLTIPAIACYSSWIALGGFGGRDALAAGKKRD